MTGSAATPTDASIDVAMKEYDRTWDYYTRIIEFLDKHTGNFYKASVLFSAVIGGLVTWAGSDVGGQRAAEIFPFLAFGGAIALIVLARVGFYTIRMMATEIANSHIYLSHLASLRRHLYEKTNLTGVTPLHLARERLRRAEGRVAQLTSPETRDKKRIHAPDGIGSDDRITALYTIASAIGAMSAALVVVGVLSLVPRQFFDWVAIWYPKNEWLIFLGRLVLAGLAITTFVLYWRLRFRRLKKMAENTYVKYVNGRIDVPEIEIGDDFFRTQEILQRPGYGTK